jgi:hypothetical protein
MNKLCTFERQLMAMSLLLFVTAECMAKENILCTETITLEAATVRF